LWLVGSAVADVSAVGAGGSAKASPVLLVVLQEVLVLILQTKPPVAGAGAVAGAAGRRSSKQPPAGVQLHLFLQALVVELQGAGAGSTTKENAMVVDQSAINEKRDEICLLLPYCTVFTGMQYNDV
jgi:hypothetical protein